MVELKLNGESIQYRGDGEVSLLTWLRRERAIVSPKNGCSGQGACGACLVEMDGKPVLSCRTPMSKTRGRSVVTIEGFEPELAALLAHSFVGAGAVQCGFCTPGFLSRTKILLESNSRPTVAEVKKSLAANLCRCTGYAKIVEAVIAAARGQREQVDPASLTGDAERGVGESRPKIQGYETALGRRSFVDDLVFDDMVYGVLKFSDHPRAKVLSISTGAAASLPGVLRVLTAEDIPGERHTGVIHRDWPVMITVGETTRYIGDVLVLVIAEDEDTARRGCQLIEVEYERLDPVTDPLEAMSNRIRVHEKGNVLAETSFSRGGDPEETFTHSAHVVEATYRTQLTEHGFLEPECAVARPVHLKEGEEAEAIQLYSQSQGIYEDRHAVANILGLPEEKVIVTLVPCGGAFGGKEDLTVQGHAALGCFHLKRPVKVALTRDESIRMHVKRHPFVMTYKLGCDEKGRLTALAAEIIGDTGAYASLGAEVLNRAAGHASGGYHVPVVWVNSKAVYTNNLPAGAMRGFGVNQVTFAMECMVDELCEKGGFDPWQFRFDNALTKGSMTATGQILGEGVGLCETLVALKEEYEKAKYPGLALGVKNIGFGNGLEDKSEARIEVISPIRLRLHHGWTEMGQGIDTVAQQIVSDVTGLQEIEIEVVSSTDSEVIGGTTTASRGTFLLGNALMEAAKKLKEELRSRSLGELVGKNYQGSWLCDWTNKPGSDVENPRTHFSYGYAAQLVLLDDEGRVEKVVAAHDAGKIINPKMFEGQIEGAVVMGLGYAFTEKLELEGGYLKSSKMGRLGIPRISSAPEIVVKGIEKRDPEGPYGAKGVGEIGLVPTAPAAINALYRFDGVRRYQLPVGRRIR